jgi:hypothetical protein
VEIGISPDQYITYGNRLPQNVEYSMASINFNYNFDQGCRIYFTDGIVQMNTGSGDGKDYLYSYFRITYGNNSRIDSNTIQRGRGYYEIPIKDYSATYIEVNSNPTKIELLYYIDTDDTVSIGWSNIKFLLVNKNTIKSDTYDFVERTSIP